MVLRSDDVSKWTPRKTKEDIERDIDTHGDIDIPVDCVCHVGVWPQHGSEAIWTASKDCVLMRPPGGRHKHADRVDIKLSGAFCIQSDELPGLDEHGRIRLESGKYFTLELKIVPESRGIDVWPPIPIRRFDIVARPQETELDGALMAKISHLPEIPSSPLPINYNKEGRILKTDYGLEIQMEWRESQRTAIRHHRSLKAAIKTTQTAHHPRLKPATPVSTPTLNSPTKLASSTAQVNGPTNAVAPVLKATSTPTPKTSRKKSVPRIQINFIFKPDRTRTLNSFADAEISKFPQWVCVGFSCPFCTPTKEYSTFNRLKLHLAAGNSHTHHKLELVLELAAPAPQLPPDVALLAWYTVAIKDQYQKELKLGQMTNILDIYRKTTPSVPSSSGSLAQVEEASVTAEDLHATSQMQLRRGRRLTNLSISGTVSSTELPSGRNSSRSSGNRNTCHSHPSPRNERDSIAQAEIDSQFEDRAAATDRVEVVTPGTIAVNNRLSPELPSEEIPETNVSPSRRATRSSTKVVGSSNTEVPTSQEERIADKGAVAVDEAERPAGIKTEDPDVQSPAVQPNSAVKTMDEETTAVRAPSRDSSPEIALSLTLVKLPLETTEFAGPPPEITALAEEPLETAAAASKTASKQVTSDQPGQLGVELPPTIPKKVSKKRKRHENVVENREVAITLPEYRSNYTPTVALEIPARIKPRHPVPVVPPGVVLYRSVSKREVQAGELLDESDDDVDQTWLKMRHVQSIKASKLSAAEKEFHERYDLHMLEERPHRVYLAASIIRFCRKNGEFLNREEIRRVFRANLHDLISKELVGYNLIWDCEMLLRRLNQV